MHLSVMFIFVNFFALFWFFYLHVKTAMLVDLYLNFYSHITSIIVLIETKVIQIKKSSSLLMLIFICGIILFFKNNNTCLTKHTSITKYEEISN